LLVVGRWSLVVGRCMKIYLLIFTTLFLLTGCVGQGQETAVPIPTPESTTAVPLPDPTVIPLETPTAEPEPEPLAEWANQLAQAAGAELPDSPELAFLLATTAFCLSPEPAAHRLLAQSWPAPDEPLLLRGHAEGVSAAVFSPDGRTILTGGDDETWRLWDKDGRQLAHFYAAPDGYAPVSSVAFSPDGQTILTASGDRVARLWDRDGRQLAVLGGHEDTVTTAVFSPDGQTILTASFDGTARLWDLEGGQLAVAAQHRQTGRNQRWLYSAVFSPDGQTILTASADETARLWDRAGNEIAVLRGHDWWVTTANFSPDGQTIVTAGHDGQIRLWDAHGVLLAEWPAHEELIWSAVFSPDGQALLTASADQTARLWDRQGELLAVWRGHEGAVFTAVFSPDGQTILTAGEDSLVRLWPSYTVDYLANEAVGRVQRGFTPTECQQFWPDAAAVCPQTVDQFYAFAAQRRCAAPQTTAPPTPEAGLTTFDGDSAFAYLEAQMAFGPRWPGSEGHTAVGDYILAELEALGWETEEQPFVYQGVAVRNLIGRANVGAGPIILIGAHYDTRKIADMTPGSTDPVPGAVDGASGVAVLLELARAVNLAQIFREIWLVFFDAEDQGGGGMPGWDWIVGSTYMAENLTVFPEVVIVVDMIGDADQQLYYEGYSDPELRETLWQIAAELGYGDFFIPQLRYTMIDDHLPFVRLGIPAVNIIDFDYDYWHTIEDTADKASPESLYRVGHTLQVWLEYRLDR
jgi:glutaminyl-peptide cyclotransferase